MPNARTILVLSLAVLGSLLSAVACGDDDDGGDLDATPAVNPSQLVGGQLPDLTGEDILGTGAVTLKSLKTPAPLVVAVWLNVCGDCQKEMPRLQSLADRLMSVRFVSVAIDDKANDRGPKGYETPRDFFDTAGLTMPTIVAPREAADAAFHLYRIPTVILVDSSGVVAKTFVWPFTTAEIEAAANALR